MQGLIIFLAQYSPPILLFGSILGFFGLVNLGPKELPRNHPLNRQLSFPILIASIGMFMFSYSNLYEIGIGIALVGFFWFIVVMKKVRDVFPRTSSKLTQGKEKKEIRQKEQPGPKTKNK